MELISLQSGSNGNSFYVKAGSRQFLFDAGITGAVAERRLESHGRTIREIDALFISHGHRDHCQAMGVYHRKYGLPVFVTEKTLQQARRDHKLGVITDLHFFKSGKTVDFGDVRVHTVRTPHDADDSVAFVIEHQNRRLGILTDMGHVFDGMSSVIAQLDAVVIESNYDPEMLRLSRYPVWLKRRVRGKGGHLSNEDSANVLRETLLRPGPARLQWACLCHLSEENNSPRVAIETHRRILGEQIPLHVASRDDVGERLLVEETGSQGSEWLAPEGAAASQLSLF